LSDGLADRGHEVVLAGLYPAPSQPLISQRARTHDLAGQAGRRLSYSLISELIELIRDVRPDVVQANGSATLKYASLARTLSRGRWPLVYRNIGVASHWLRYPGHQLWARWLLRPVVHVAAVSHHSREDFRRTFGVPAARITTIPIGVNVPDAPGLVDARLRLEAITGIPRSGEILLHVGSFTPEKNHLWLIEAFSRLRRLRPSAHLVLIGDGALRPAVESEIAASGLSEVVHVLGTRSDVPKLVGGADILVLSSKTEGISGVILEAAAEAVAAVSTNVGSISEAIEDGITGILVPPGDIGGFVSALARLLEDPGQRRTMGRCAYDLVKETYAMNRIVSRFEQLYTGLCAGQVAQA
jgi:glycosyltransferase involved in cell wall biosynthesis